MRAFMGMRGYFTARELDALAKMSQQTRSLTVTETFSSWYMDWLTLLVRLNELTAREHSDMVVEFWSRERLANQAAFARE